MSRRWRAVIPAYLALLLGLAAVGGVNQALYRQQLRLMDRKASLQTQLAELRSRAEAVRGPLAVAAWAGAHGMVPAPEAQTLIPVAPAPAPSPALPQTGLEIRTLWR